MNGAHNIDKHGAKSYLSCIRMHILLIGSRKSVGFLYITNRVSQIARLQCCTNGMQCNNKGAETPMRHARDLVPVGGPDAPQALSHIFGRTLECVRFGQPARPYVHRRLCPQLCRRYFLPVRVVVGSEPQQQDRVQAVIVQHACRRPAEDVHENDLFWDQRLHRIRQHAIHEHKHRQQLR